MSVHRDGDIELDEDMDFQRKQWRFERAAWVVFALVLVFGMLGLFGTGPLSAATAGGGGVSVDYQRFVRHQGQTGFTVTIDARHAVNGQVELTIDGDYLNNLAIEWITPDPLEVHGDGSDVVYVFALAEGAESIEVSIGALPRSMGSLGGSVAAGGTTVTFFQLAYP